MVQRILQMNVVVTRGNFGNYISTSIFSFIIFAAFLFKYLYYLTLPVQDSPEVTTVNSFLWYYKNGFFREILLLKVNPAISFYC